MFKTILLTTAFIAFTAGAASAQLLGGGAANGGLGAGGAGIGVGLSGGVGGVFFCARSL